MSETPPEPPVWSVVHVDYADEHGIIMQRYPRGWTEPGRDCDAPGFAYDTWADVCAMGATMLLTPASEPWLELARRVTKAQRTYARLADECWRDLDVNKALRYRGMAEGLDMARDHHSEVIAEFHEGAGERGAAMKRELAELRGLVDAYLDANDGDESEEAYVALRDAVEHRRAVEKRLAAEASA